jgi:hypothetical protein
MEVIELSDDEPSPAVRKPSERPAGAASAVTIDLLQNDGAGGGASEGGASEGGGGSVGLGGASAGVRITIDLCDDENGRDGSVVDLTGDDDVSLARKLQRQLNSGGGSSKLDLAALHAAREARRAKIKADPDAVAVSVEDDDLLFSERNKLSSFLERSMQGMRVVETWHNPSSQPGGALYERFVAAWAHVPNKLMRMVFHGTAEANVQAICRDGLDPQRRAGQALGPGECMPKGPRTPD